MFIVVGADADAYNCVLFAPVLAVFGHVACFSLNSYGAINGNTLCLLLLL